MLTSYKRLRHTYGFGVHSPFAYALVTNAIRPRRYSFYGYEDIDDTFSERLLPKVRREARLLLRLAVFLQPKTTFLPTGIHAAYHAALHAADSHMKIERKPHNVANCDCICSSADYIPLDTLCKQIKRPNVTIAIRDFKPGWETALFDAMSEGVMLLGKRNLIIISHPGMQKLTYTMLV